MANNNIASSTSNESRDSRWYFSAEQLANSPSRRQGINADQELSYRQLTAYLIQEMGQRLSVSQLCINTAIVYMHRFYAFHSFTHFHRNGIAAASLFLAAKVEEQPRKLEHVIKVAHLCLSTEFPHASSEMYNEQAQDLVFNENVLLQTLGFDVAIDHPHTHVVKTCHLVKACKDLAQTSYFLASNSLHLTSMCLQYRPTVVACFCIYLACKWSRWEIPQSTEGKHWFHYVDTSVTLDLLKQLTDEFLAIYEKSPARLKSKLNSIKALAQSARMNEPQRPITDANGSNTQLPTESARRPESYSSHHRHHSSSGTHHNHQSKSLLALAEPVDHSKSSTSHKQSYPTSSGSTHASRQSRTDRSDRSQAMIPETQTYVAHAGNSKQTIAPPGLQRPSSSNRPPPHAILVPASTCSSSQRLPHAAHDANYHKSRSTVAASLNQGIVSGHKSLPKDQQRSLLKDPLGRAMDPNKMSSKHSNLSGISSGSNSNNSNSYTGPNMNSTGVDMTRSNPSAAQHSLQRAYVQPSNNAQPLPYNQVIPSRGSSSSSTKYEQTVQQQTHLQSGQKQLFESSYSQQANSRPLEESTNVKVEQMEICSPTKYPPSQQAPPSLTLQTSQHNPPPLIASINKASSIFSPEWSDKVSSHSVLPLSMGVKASSESLERPSTLGINIKTNRDSPKKIERERRSETPKKEKVRPELQLVDANKVLQASEKRNSNKKYSDSSDLQAVQIPTSMLASYDMKNQQALNLSAVKRPSEPIGRMEDEREYKVRKVDSQSPSKMIGDQRQFPFDQSSNALETLRSNKPAFSSTINGIETDPDLVRNLLKESLCTENKFSIKTDNILEYADIKPIEPIRDMETLPVQLLQNESPLKETLKEDSVVLTAVTETSDGACGDPYLKPKAEKKKKKDKHKHKEKDKSKEKEERKKHKKDKEKCKERDRSSGNEQEQNHVKLTIPKEKLNLTSFTASTPIVTTSQLKIKIPKDRIRADYQLDDSVNIISQQSLAPSLQPSSLKIKISKDKIESYSHNQHNSSSSYSNSISAGHHSHHSSKKKDRDRDKDRDKDKKRSSSNNSSDHNKQNGGGSGGGANSGVSDASSASAANKTASTNSNKFNSAEW